MSLQFYNVLHILGITLLFISLGGLALHSVNGGTRTTNQWRLIVAITHGVALALLLVSGFGMLAKLGFTGGIPAWAIVKILVWLVFGGAIAFVGRSVKLAKVFFFLLPLLGALSGYLAIYKPF
jgi:uncharacterized membrane protein SirB2